MSTGDRTTQRTSDNLPDNLPDNWPQVAASDEELSGGCDRHTGRQGDQGRDQGVRSRQPDREASTE